MASRTLTGNNRRREQRVQSLILDRLVLRYRGRIMSEIRRAMRKVATNVAEKKPKPIGAAMFDHRKRMTSLLSRLWAESGHDMAEHLDPLAKAGGRRFGKQDEDDELGITPTEIADQVMFEWIRTEGVQKVTQIVGTTQTDLQKVISSGIQDGASEKEIAKRIRAVAPSISGTRSDTIARTETHAAANTSALATAKATGLNLVKEWAAAEDERTRKAHDDADGQRRELDEPFNVGGEELNRPGDPNGRAANVINCRCAVLYVVV